MEYELFGTEDKKSSVGRCGIGAVTTHDYRKEIEADIIDYVRDNKDYYKGLDDDELYEKLNDDLWIADSVTGNGSGSYYFNYHEARKAVAGNEDLLCEAIEEFGGDSDSYKRAMIEPEYADVTIRCYLVGQCLNNVFPKIKRIIKRK